MSEFRKHSPSFKPTGLHFKCEDGTDSNPLGPLYYADGKQYEPVYVDTGSSDTRISGKLASAWLSLRQAKKIAKAEHLPLDVF